MKTVVILSGGMDSAVLLDSLIGVKGEMGYDPNDEVRCLTFDYGQRHSKEIECARDLCTHFHVASQLIDLTSIAGLIDSSSQTSKDIAVPHGHYAEESMKKTVVPNRNMIMLSIALGYVANIGFDQVAIGIHSGDHFVYPDCRPPFIYKMQEVAQVCHFNPIQIQAPFLTMDKGQVCALGIALGTPFQKTWTCYEGEELSCGKCGACRERLEAFEFANKENLTEIKDPLEYRKE